MTKLIPTDLDTRPLTGGHGTKTLTGQLGDGKTLYGFGLWPFWGTAVGLGVKQNETRHWYKGFRGPLAIYQTKSVMPDAKDTYALLKHRTGEEKPYGIPDPKDCPKQSIIAIARVVGGVECPDPKYGQAFSASFTRGDGLIETRQVPPPEDSAEYNLGFYSTCEETEETRYAWVLTDVLTLPEPLALPTTDGGSRQGLFKVPPDAARHCLTLYREFLVSLRPKCKYCGVAVGSDEKHERGLASWKWLDGQGWKHWCPIFGGSEFHAFTMVKDEDRPRLMMFQGEGLMRVAEYAPPPPAPTQPPRPQTASLF